MAAYFFTPAFDECLVTGLGGAVLIVIVVLIVCELMPAAKS